MQIRLLFSHKTDANRGTLGSAHQQQQVGQPQPQQRSDDASTAPRSLRCSKTQQKWPRRRRVESFSSSHTTHNIACLCACTLHWCVTLRPLRFSPAEFRTHSLSRRIYFCVRAARQPQPIPAANQTPSAPCRGAPPPPPSSRCVVGRRTGRESARKEKSARAYVRIERERSPSSPHDRACVWICGTAATAATPPPPPPSPVCLRRRRVYLHLSASVDRFRIGCPRSRSILAAHSA